MTAKKRLIKHIPRRGSGLHPSVRLRPEPLEDRLLLTAVGFSGRDGMVDGEAAVISPCMAQISHTVGDNLDAVRHAAEGVIYAIDDQFMMDGASSPHQTTPAAGERYDKPLTSPKPMVRMQVQIVDLEGHPIDTINTGEVFELRVFTEDLREVPFGLFAAFLDVNYPVGLVAVDGPIVHSSPYDNLVVHGSTHTPGVIDEVGGAGPLSELGAGSFEVFRIQMRAGNTPGVARFHSDAADEALQHAVLAYLINDVIDPSVIDFGSATLTINASGNWQPQPVDFEKALIESNSPGAAVAPSVPLEDMLTTPQPECTLLYPEHGPIAYQIEDVGQAPAVTLPAIGFEELALGHLRRGTIIDNPIGHAETDTPQAAALVSIANADAPSAAVFFAAASPPTMNSPSKAAVKANSHSLVESVMQDDEFVSPHADRLANASSAFGSTLTSRLNVQDTYFAQRPQDADRSSQGRSGKHLSVPTVDAMFAELSSRTRISSG